MNCLVLVLPIKNYNNSGLGPVKFAIAWTGMWWVGLRVSLLSTPAVGIK